MLGMFICSVDGQDPTHLLRCNEPEIVHRSTDAGFLPWTLGWISRGYSLLREGCTVGWCIDKKLLPESRLLALGNTWFLCRSWTLCFGWFANQSLTPYKIVILGREPLWSIIMPPLRSDECFFLSLVNVLLRALWRFSAFNMGQLLSRALKSHDFRPRAEWYVQPILGVSQQKPTSPSSLGAFAFFLMLAGCLFSSWKRWVLFLNPKMDFLSNLKGLAALDELTIIPNC